MEATAKRKSRVTYAAPILLPSRRGRSGRRIANVTASTAKGTPVALKLSTYAFSEVGRGAFGVVYRADVVAPIAEEVAVKKVREDPRYLNRELDLLKKLSHCNIVGLKYYFVTMEIQLDGPRRYMNMVLEFVPKTLQKLLAERNHRGNRLSLFEVKLYSYQLLRAVAYVHSLGICHRDIKPENLLVDEHVGVLKVCDFSSAKHLKWGEPNVPYVCARSYRAPELLFGSTFYTSAVDIWASGCIISELVLGVPLFQSSTTSGQIVQVIEVLGTPTMEEISQMNPTYGRFSFPPVKPHPWHHIFRRNCREVAQLARAMLVYVPENRLGAFDALAHKLFNELRDRGRTLPSGAPLPPLFNFSLRELSIKPSLNVVLIPPHAQGVAAQVHYHTEAWRAGVRAVQ